MRHHNPVPEPGAEHDAKVRQLAADIAARLRSVCSTLSDQEFNDLVADIARMKIRLEVLEDLPGGLRPLRDSKGG